MCDDLACHYTKIPPQYDMMSAPPGEVEPSHVEMNLEEASLGIEVLNPRPQTQEISGDLRLSQTCDIVPFWMALDRFSCKMYCKLDHFGESCYYHVSWF